VLLIDEDKLTPPEGVALIGSTRGDEEPEEDIVLENVVGCADCFSNHAIQSVQSKSFE
jgi:hypothetical protein